MSDKRECPDCGEKDPEKFYTTGRRCKRCKSSRASEQYRIAHEAGGRVISRKITKYQNTAIWLRAKKVGMKPCKFVKAMRIEI